MSAFLEMKEEHIEMKIKKEEPDYEDHLAISPVPIPVRGDKTEILQIKKEKIEPDYEDHLDGMGTLAVPLTDRGLPEIQSENPEIKLEEGRHLDQDEIVVKLTDEENTLNEEDSWDFDTFLQLRHQNILVLETNYSVSVIEESQMVSNGMKPSNCTDCGKEFRTPQLLTSHQRIHKQRKLYTCTMCGKNFLSNNSLKVHQRLHTGQKPFICEECGKSFNSKANMSLHQRSHTGEKPFTCKECGKKFARNDHLKLHERTHARSKPFYCTECGEKFTYKNCLSAHIKTFHRGLSLVQNAASNSSTKTAFSHTK